MAQNKERADNAEDMDFEIRFLEGVVEKSPDFIEALINLGDLYTKRGSFEKGLAVDLKLSSLRPGDPIILYNLACSYSLMNDPERSLEAIQRAVQHGYRDVDFLSQDRDLANLRKFPPFLDFLARIRAKV